MLANDAHWKDDIDKRDPDYSFTALHYASKYGHAEFMVLLIDHGADVSARIPDGRTCLHLAATYSGAATVNELVIHGARVDDRDSFGLTPLDLARQNNNLSALRALQKWSSFRDESVSPDLPAQTFVTENEVLMFAEKEKSVGLRLLDARVSRLRESRQSESQDRLSCASLRLLEKHACLCLAEGFNEEAVDSLLLRWQLARQLHLEDPAQLPLSSCLKVVEELVDFCVRDGNLRSAMDYIDDCLELLGDDDSPRNVSDSHHRWHTLNRRLEVCSSLSHSDDSYLGECLTTIHRSLKLSNCLFDYTHGEPLEILPVMEREVDALERMERYPEVVLKAAALASISRRHQGNLHPQSISLKLNHIRLLFIYAQINRVSNDWKEQIEFIGSVAEALLSEMQELNPNNAEAYGLLKRCTEFVAAAQLLKKGVGCDLNDALQSQVLSKAITPPPW